MRLRVTKQHLYFFIVVSLFLLSCSLIRKDYRLHQTNLFQSKELKDSCTTFKFQQDSTYKHLMHVNYSQASSVQMNYNGFPRFFLKKNVLKGRNVLTQSAMIQDSTIYVVKYNFDLNGDTLTVPNNCVLQFVGGSLKNGTLSGQHTIIRNEGAAPIFKDIYFTGNYCQPYICSDWFKYESLNELFDAIQKLATSDIITQIIIKKMSTSYTPIVRGFYCGEKTSYLFKIPSNTVVDFCGSELTLEPNDISFFYALYIQDVTNVEVKNLTLIGDIERHTPTRYNEYSHGVYIYAAENIIINSIISMKFWGDGIAISGYTGSSMPLNKNVYLKKCKFIKNRRQGCSITKGENIFFENCEFLETGSIKATPPTAGVDIEPNNKDDVLKNIVFEKCKFLDNEGHYGGLLIMTAKMKDDLDAEQIRFLNCEIDGIHQYGKGGGYLKSCVIKNTKNRNNCLNASRNQIIEDCVIEFDKNNLESRPSINLKYVNNHFYIR